MNEHIVREIENYMNNPLKYALLLEGTWGSGKTYFVQNQLKEIDTCYISLNGISNLNSLSFQIAYQLLGNKLLTQKGISRKIHKGNKIVGTIGSILASHIESKINVDLSELVKLLGNINLSEKLIIFDDLERCSISLEEILGFINSLVEHNQIKVLIIANEDELVKDIAYSRIKEKLIYQTFKYIPNLEKLYDKLIIDDVEECKNNKSFFINELKRTNHYNIRTIQFVFQRYKELRKIIKKIIPELTTDKIIIKQIYDDIFKYMIVISRDYKLGKKIGNFEENGQLSHYQLIDNSYYSITSFKFVDVFIQGFLINEEIIKGALTNYINEIKSSLTKEIGSLSILNRWWESEDEDIEQNTNSILIELQKETYSFDLYPKILVYLIKITHIGFPSKFLTNALLFMKNNIEKCPEYVSLGYRILDANFSKEEKDKYEKVKNQLTEIIEKHNNEINKNGIQSLKEKEPGELGQYFHKWCYEHRDIFMKKKKFINEIGIDNIIYIVNNGNSCDVRYLLYLFNETYNFANVKQLYPNDGNTLSELLSKLNEVNILKFSIMKKDGFNLLKDSISNYIEMLK